MQFDDAQKKLIAQWAAEGSSLAEIQKRINDEFKLSLTFMDVRLLILDQGIELKDRRSSVSSPRLDLTRTPPADSLESRAPGREPTPPAPEGSAQGAVTVEIDKLKKPGALVNGTVTFSDGVSASWALDQFGRLAIDPGQPGYRPSESDVHAFQQELSRLMQTRGL